MPEFETIRFEVEGPPGAITLNRPSALTGIGNAAVRPEEVTATFGAGADRTFRVR